MFRMSIMLASMLRFSLVLGLLSLFLWQTYSSLGKYLDSGTTVYYEMEYPDEQPFPKVTFCALSNDLFVRGGKSENVTSSDPDDDGDRDSIFSDAGVLDSIYLYSHGGGKNGSYYLSEVMGKDVPANLRGVWKVQRVMADEIGQMIACLSYSPEDLFVGGLASELTAFVSTRGLSQFHAYVREPEQDLLAYTALYGTAFVSPPYSREGFDGANMAEHFAYKISVEVHRAMSTEAIPCYEDGDQHNLNSCVDSFFTSKEGCRLTWMPGGKETTAECSTRQLERYVELKSKIQDFGPKELYQKTGCYYNCEYKKYTVDLVDQSVYPKRDPSTLRTGLLKERDDAQHYDLSLSMFLSPNGIVHTTLTLAYDAYDLVGDMGGYLGLWLGASVLSLYDDLVRRAGKKVVASWGKL